MSDSTPPTSPLKCQGCGFLAVRNFKTRALSEVEAGMRKTGESPSMRDVPSPRPSYYDSSPICFVQQYDLAHEAEALGNDEAFLIVIEKERACPAFTPWRQGHSPREHKEMIDSREQLKWQEERMQADRQLENERREADRRHAAEQKEHDLRLDRELRESNTRYQQRQKWADRAWGLFVVLVAAALGWLFSHGKPAIVIQEKPQVVQPDTSPK